ncbi:hypothetical protein DKX38_013267 [Salix brachista]|uniref:Ribosomal RNA-processing protein 14 N-terminal domain-containing protein n=1 Tax=Salix brachista TaxID=2182728 RepID=A0A5N5LQQ8_9ROSI|nr:hypothetical protein DKX38_013267 [Salix brachista]
MLLKEQKLSIIALVIKVSDVNNVKVVGCSWYGARLSDFSRVPCSEIVQLECSWKLLPFFFGVRSGCESDPDIDLKFPIHQHSLICDKLIKLVPAKFYLPTDEKEKPWFHGLSKGGAKASAKKRQGKLLTKQGENAIIPRIRYEELRQRLHREIEDFEEIEIAVSQREQRRGGRRKLFCKRNARGNLGLKKRSQAQVLHRKAWRRMRKKL